MTNKEILIKEFGSADLVEAMPELVLSSLMDAAREDEAGKWEAQLKAERERAGKLVEALVFLKEGVAGLPPLTAIAGVLTQQYLAAETAINEYNNKP